MHLCAKVPRDLSQRAGTFRKLKEPCRSPAVSALHFERRVVMERETLILRGLLAIGATVCMLALGSMLWLGSPAHIAHLQSLAASSHAPACAPAAHAADCAAVRS
jgi:hypothetical protein